MSINSNSLESPSILSTEYITKLKLAEKLAEYFVLNFSKNWESLSHFNNMSQLDSYDIFHDIQLNNKTNASKSSANFAAINLLT